MNKFKKAFRGYRVAEVERRITQLEAQLEESETRSRALESRCSEAEMQLEKERERLASKEEELERLNTAYDRLANEQKDQKIEAESIGRIYLKAFESGREIAAAPISHINVFLDAVEEVAEKSRGEMTGIKNKIGTCSEKIAALLLETKKQAELMEGGLAELAAAAEGIDSAYAMFEQVRSDADAKIEKIKADYEKNTADYGRNELHLQNPDRADGAEHFPGSKKESGLPTEKEANKTVQTRPLLDKSLGEAPSGDTRSDFRDGIETGGAASGSENLAGDAASKSPETMRKESIFDLINKYKQAK